MTAEPTAEPRPAPARPQRTFDSTLKKDPHTWAAKKKGRVGRACTERGATDSSSSERVTGIVQRDSLFPAAALRLLASEGGYAPPTRKKKGTWKAEADGMLRQKSG